MEPRLNSHQANPDVVKPMMAMGKAVHDSGLDEKLVQLIEIRASQINGCGF
jgi:alkylhydroperoxidase family enzyme